MRRSARLAVESLEGKALLSGAVVTASGLSESLTATPSRTTAGTSIVLTFTETNVTDHDISVTLAQSTDGFVASKGGRPVWTSNPGVQPGIVTVETLKPGQSLTLSETWDGVSNTSAGGPALKGRFVIHNELAPDGPTATVTLLPAVAAAKSPHKR